MGPPPVPLVRASASQSDSLLDLIVLAKRICHLAAEIDNIDRAARPKRFLRSAASRSSAGTSDQGSLTAPLCSFLCPAVTGPASGQSDQDAFPRSRSRHGFPSPNHTSSSPHSPGLFRHHRPYSQSVQYRGASTAAAAIKLADTHVDQHPGPSPSSHGHFPLHADPHWQEDSENVASPATATRSHNCPNHWLSSWQPAGAKSQQEDLHVRSRMKQALDEHRAEFGPGWRERSETNGLNRRRLAAHRLWRAYQTHAHKEKLSTEMRVTVANALVLSVHYVTTNKAHSPQSKALRHLVGRRIHAILQDCRLVRAKRFPSSRSSPASKNLNMTISLLEPVSLALQAQPVAALKLMDEILLRTRPDIYRHKTDQSSQGEYLSPIHATLLTIVDSIDFEINCHPTASNLTNAILSQPHFFEDDGMLADLEKGLEAPSESGDPIKSFLDWIIDSPHAFLLSHKDFRSARTMLFHCLSQVRDPHRLLERFSQDRDPEQPGFVYACDLLLRSRLRISSEAALELYDDLWSRGVHVADSLVNQLIRESGGQAPAARLEALLHRATNPKAQIQGRVSIPVLRSVALAWAKRNRSDRVTSLLAYLKRRSSKGHDEFSQQVHVELAAARGDVQSLYERLAERYDFAARSVDECTVGKIPLDGKAYALLIKSCNRSDDVDLAEFYLTEALERGIPPRSSDFNLVIDMHVRKTNIDAALAIFDQMKEFGVHPDTYTYTILIHGFALRRDPDSAAHALRALIAAGKSPDRITYAALLNCFVESGLYESAIRLFGWMQDQRDVRIRPTIEVCNIILKAYVLSALPVQKVMKFVDNVRKLGLLPNASTYALMLQSACDAGLMDVAEEVFSEAEVALPNLTGSGQGQGANVYHFTIMMHGYLRLGDQAEAKDYFDEMQGRKLTPSAITWSVMVHSYAHSENEANYDLACNLVSQLVADETKRIFRPSTWDVPATRSQLARLQNADRAANANRQAAKYSAPFQSLYTVLMVAQARRGEPDKVEETLKTMSRHMPTLSVSALTPLLDAYRRAGDVDSALVLFEQIYESALKSARSNSRRVYMYSKPSAEDAGDTVSQALDRRRQDASSRNLLCLPVSIMVDLLSTAGRHEEIVKIWARAKGDGFGFDSDNWNHLAASMARAGQLDEALSVVEHVLYRDPPNAWMRSRLNAGGGSRNGHDHGVEGEADKLEGPAVLEGSGGESPDGVNFDPLPANTLLDPAALHRSDATSAPAEPLSRRHQNRTDDDPYVDLPFERREPTSSEDDDADSEVRLPSQSHIEPSAFYLDSSAKLPYKRDLVPTTADSFSPWYAHFATMEAISRGLAELREASKVITLLDRYKTAAGLLDLHERKVEIIRERQKEEAVRSARDLIDGRG